MNPTTVLCLTTAIALSTYGVMAGISFVSNSAHAANSSSYSTCATVNNRLVCTTSPDNVCTYYGPNSVVCDSRNSQATPNTPDTPND